LGEAAERLWPDRTPTAAQDLLHQATSILRHALEPELPTRFPSRYLRFEDGTVKILSSWAPDLASWVDFASFESACGQGNWETALTLYKGDFLPGIPYAEWTIPLRQHFSTLHQQALLEAARCRYAAGNFAATLPVCKRLVEIEPWQEQAVLIGMQAAVALKDVATARRLYQTLKKTLQEELGVAPQPELQEFFRSL
jgi:DNA-binding SARP family transcriptional activator